MVLPVLDSSPVLSKLGIKVLGRLNYIPVLLQGISLVISSIAFMQFIMEEAIQVMSNSIEMLIQAKHYAEAGEMIDHLYNRYYLPFVYFNNSYGSWSPFTDDAWGVYLDSVLLMIIGLKNKVGSA
jgi:hypothetical protein